MNRFNALLAALLVVGPACRGPAGPVVHVTVDLDRDHEVLADAHRIEVVATLGAGPSRTLLFPEAGPSAAPLPFPSNLALIASGLAGPLDLVITALDDRGKRGGRGVATLDLAGSALHHVSVAIGAASTCGDGRPAPDGAPREVCFLREGADLPIGGGDPGRGNIGNGVGFFNFDGTGGLDLLVAWDGDFNRPADVSGASLYPGSRGAGTQVSYTQELVLPDGERRGNTEAAVANLVGDADGGPDLFNDVVASARGTRDLAVWPGRGDNSFGTPVLIPLGESPAEMHVGDLVPDVPGLELAVGLRSAPSLLVVGHETAGMPPAPIARSAMPVGVGTRGFQLIDLDGDSFLDLVVTAKGEAESMPPTQGKLTVHLNDGHGVFATTVVSEEELGTRDVAVVDLDRDGRPDLATVNEETGELSIRIGRSPTAYADPVRYPLQRRSEAKAEPERLRFGDVDGDGVTDLLACDRSVGAIFVLIMGPDGAPAQPPVRLLVGREPGTKGEDIQGCAAADSDGDGVLDLVAVVERPSKTVRVLRRIP